MPAGGTLVERWLPAGRTLVARNDIAVETYITPTHKSPPMKRGKFYKSDCLFVYYFGTGRDMEPLKYSTI